MEYTLETLLNDGILDWWKPITEGIDYGCIAVRSISVQELPLAPFVTPGEVVLSIAHGAGDDPEMIQRIVEEAGASGAAAVFFAFDDERKQVTADVRRYAEQIGLPLLLIDFRQKFTDIQEKVNRAIRSLELEPYARLQSDLFNAYFEGASLDDAARRISGSLSLPIAIADTYGEILAQTQGFEIVSAGDIVIDINGTQLGVLKLALNELLRERREILKQYISFPLSLWFHQQRIEMITDARMVNDFALRLASGEWTEELRRESGFLRMDLRRRYRAVVLEPVTDSLDRKMELVRSTYDILQSAMRAGKAEKLTVICGADAERFLAFVECPNADSGKMAGCFVEKWTSAIKKLIPISAVRCGVSRAFIGNGGFADAYHEALLSATYCGDDNKPVYYEEARKIRIVSAVLAQEAIRSDAQELLSRIIAYDKNGGSMELMKTLTTFIKASYNVSETARQLCIHRQSLLARMQKIEDLTGLSIKEHDDLFVLEVYSRLFANY